jgi:hypothetical protein
MRSMADPDSQSQRGSAGSANGSLARSGAANGGAANPGVVAANGRGVNGRVAKRDSDEIVAEIERTRQNLARTIDTLADRVSPASNVRRLKERASAELAKPEVQLAAAAAAVVLTGIVVYRVWARRRR